MGSHPVKLPLSYRLGPLGFDPEANTRPVNATMINPDSDDTLNYAFAKAAERYADKPFLMVPPRAERDYDENGKTLTYAETAADVAALSWRYAEAGYGHGHRIALLLDNRLEHVTHRMAMNAVGVSVVPINPEYRAQEIAYLVEHSDSILIVVISARLAQVKAGLDAAGIDLPIWIIDLTPLPALPVATTPVPLADVDITASSESSLLYTSGTTGRPKGCMLSHRYELESGHWYANRGGLMTLSEGVERIYNPLPLYHINAGCVSLFGAMLTGNCQVQPDRFHPATWWQELTECGATVMHYLGIVAPLLLNQLESPWEKRHSVRLGLGAGIEPDLHEVFEDRFGFPLVELWGMTEMVRILAVNEEPRHRGTRAFGRPVVGLEARVVDDNDADVAIGEVGELVVRHSEQTPRAGAFSGYLKDPEATETGWRGGWWHSGDVVRQSPDGMLHFVDRKKNIIRRSGENIAAAEIEAWLQTHPAVAGVAVTAVPDELRDEEVMACIVTNEGIGATGELAETLFAFCLENLAYYKAPGWLLFMAELPTTGTQKIQKHRLFEPGTDPRTQAGINDFRDRKRRQTV